MTSCEGLIYCLIVSISILSCLEHILYYLDFFKPSHEVMIYAVICFGVLSVGVVFGFVLSCSVG